MRREILFGFVMIGSLIIRNSLCDILQLILVTVQNHQAKVSVVPSAASLVVKAFTEPERDRKKVKNIKHTVVIFHLMMLCEISKIMRPESMILGTCVSVGCTVDGKNPKDLQDEIADGTVEIP
ncbi:hypothetical protein MKX01_037186 [Papaver californicum]|nr:hypothetical protein MKX01_037186 [Papaver californicum]